MYVRPRPRFRPRNAGTGFQPSLALNFLSGSLDSSITFSRGTQATQYTSNGTLQYAPNNLLTYSNQADNAAWTKSNSFVQTNLLTFSDAAVANYSLTSGTVVNTTPISGFTNSVRFPDNSATIVAYKTYTAAINTLYTISAYVQMDDNSAPVLSSSAFSGDLTLVVDSNPAPLNLTVTSVGSGVYRVSASYTTAAFTGTNIGVVKYNTQSAKGFKVTGLQLVQGSVPGNYVATTSAALPVLYADYNGVVRARKLCEDAANSQHYWSQPTAVTAGYAYTVSFKAKAAEKTQIVYTWNVAGTAFAAGAATFNLSAGTVTPSGAATGTITALGNGWYLCTTTNVCTTTSAASAHYWSFTGLTTYVGDGTSGIYLTDNQVELGSTAQAYNDTTSAAYYGPRFDYDPVTKVLRGLLIEEQRANLLLQSNDFQTSWLPTNITRTLASTTGPDGTLSGVKLEATAAAATNLNQLVTSTATAHTFSVQVKQGTGATTANSFILRNNTTATNLVGGTLNYGTGVFTYTVGSTGVVVTNIGNGWWRIAITATAGITVGDGLLCYVGFNGGVQAAGDFLYAYGAQLEAGAFATSYIPTVASQVTRSADSASITTLTPWFNATAGTMLNDYDVIAPVSGAAFAISIFHDGTASNRAYVFIGGGSGAPSFVVTSGGVAQANISNSVIAANAATKTAGAYALNDFAVVTNNGTVATDLAGSLPVGQNKLELGSFLSGAFLNGHLRNFTYYPTRLPNATLQGLTV